MANNTNKTNWEDKSLGALWKKTSKTGDNKFFTGTLTFKDAVPAGGQVQIIIFSNKNKKSENQPDANVYISEPLAGQAAPVKTTVAPQKKVVAPIVQETPEEELI